MRCSLVLLLWPLMGAGQSTNEADTWRPLRFLEGAWLGAEEGVPGVGQGERICEFLFGKYLHCKNVSRFDPQPKNPKGEIHYDWGFFSHDDARGLALREFHSEGYVIRYRVDEAASSQQALVFLSESIENGAPEMRARLTIQLVSPTEFKEIFELAPDGEKFGVLLSNRWQKKTE